MGMGNPMLFCLSVNDTRHPRAHVSRQETGDFARSQNDEILCHVALASRNENQDAIEENFATRSYDLGENLEPLSGLAGSKSFVNLSQSLQPSSKRQQK